MSILRRLMSLKAGTTMQANKFNNFVRIPEPSHPEWQELVSNACESLKKENVIAVPTDTIYGIAGLAQSTSAIRKINEMKGRHCTKALSISVGDVEDVYKWGKVTVSDDLLRELLPGPVTVLFERQPALNPNLNEGFSCVGIRVPDSGFVRDVSRACQQPLALTSANPSAAGSTLAVQEFSCLWPHLDKVFDGGVLGDTEKSRLGSTIVDLSKGSSYHIIRSGSAYTETVEVLTRYGLTEFKDDS